MNNTLSNLTVIVLTYKTDLEILKNCIKSIDTTVNINLIENSVELKDKKKIKDLNPNINFFCTGENLGYGMGNNFGLKNTKTRYIIFQILIKKKIKLNFLLKIKKKMNVII